MNFVLGFCNWIWNFESNGLTGNGLNNWSYGISQQCINVPLKSKKMKNWGVSSTTCQISIYWLLGRRTWHLTLQTSSRMKYLNHLHGSLSHCDTCNEMCTFCLNGAAWLTVCYPMTKHNSCRKEGCEVCNSHRAFLKFLKNQRMKALITFMITSSEVYSVQCFSNRLNRAEL